MKLFNSGRQEGSISMLRVIFIMIVFFTPLSVLILHAQQNFFGEEFRKYKLETAEFFPFPLKKNAINMKALTIMTFILPT